MPTPEVVQEFHTMKALLDIHNKENPGYKRCAIVEYRDGHHEVANLRMSDRARSDKAAGVPADVEGHIRRISEVERITFFVDGEEFEFAACQG